MPIQTTHTGSLPRPPGLHAMLAAGATAGSESFEQAVRDAVHDVVAHQLDLGLGRVGDGEMARQSYVTYALDRLEGFGGEAPRLVHSDLREHPESIERAIPREAIGALAMPMCTGTVRYRGHPALRRDLANLRDALRGRHAAEAFVTAASPGVLALFFPNASYPSDEHYLEALADAMREEYHAIVEAGFTLQLDAPDLAMGRHVRFADANLSSFLRRIDRHLTALGHAVADIEPSRMRLHVCWGNYEGPHHHDLPLVEILPRLLRTRPAALSFAAANPRHEHEWRVWETIRLPASKILMPGVIDPTTNFVEHPDLVAERIIRFVRVVGRERVVASTDCGFATFATMSKVVPSVVWAKLSSLVEGARRADVRA